MLFQVTYQEFKNLAAAMSVTKTVVYALDTSDLTKVAAVTVLDPKLGGASFAFIDPTQFPTETAFTADFSGAIRVTGIS